MAFRGNNPVVDTFRFLANCLIDSGGEVEQCLWGAKRFIFPYSDAGTEVTLTDFYGDTHWDVFESNPKVVTYMRLDGGREAFEENLRSIINEMCENKAGKGSPRVEVDFVKLLLNSRDRADPADLTTVGEIEKSVNLAKGNFAINTIRCYLPEGADPLIGILENLGATLMRRDEQNDTLRCVCFHKYFKHRGQKFGGSLYVNPDNLVFSSWNTSRNYSEVVNVSNPGPAGGALDNEFVCDVRIKGMSKTTSQLDDIHDCWTTLGRRPPPELTTPGLNDLFWRNDAGNGFIARPNSQISELLEKTNKVHYHFEKEGISIVLSVADGRDYKVDSDGSCKVTYSYECWPKLLFFVENRQQIPMIVDFASRCVADLLDALTGRRLDVRPWRSFLFALDGSTVRCTTAQTLRRISENSTLEGMLGLPGRGIPELAARLHEVLDLIANVPALNYPALNSQRMRKKLLEAAQNRGVE